MGLLGPLGALVFIGRLGEVVGPVSVADELPHRLQGLAGDPGGVGPHIGDEAHRPFIPQFHALIELLRQGHGLFGGEPELAVGLHLQAAGDEGRRGIAPLRLLLDLGHPELGGLQVVQNPLHLPGAVGLDGLGAVLQQVGQEPRRLLAPARQASRDQYSSGTKAMMARSRSHTRRRATDCTRPALRPVLTFCQRMRADLVAHQAVEDAPGLLGIVAGPVQRHRVGQGLLDGLLGQLQEQHPVEAVVLLPQGLGDVPGDGLAFPVRVGAQVDLRDIRRGLLQLLDDLGLAQDGDVFRGKIVLQVHPQLVGGQVPDVAFAGEDHIVAPQIFLQGLGLGG